MRGVPAEEAGALWPTVYKLLEPSVELWRGRYDSPSLLALVERDQWQLWVAEEDGQIVAAGLTFIAVYPTGLKECNIAVLGGDGAGRWPLWIENIKRWAASIGCRCVVGKSPRRGWERVLEPAGFEIEGRIYSVELNDG